MTTGITILKTRVPTRVCKSYELVDGSLKKTAVASIAKADAFPRPAETAQELAAILREVAESNDLALVCGQWTGGNQPFEVVTEAELSRLMGVEVGKVEGGVHEIKGRRVAARLKRGFEPSVWTLFDADNPEGMPANWRELSIHQRMEMFETILPGLSTCERVEVRSSSARVSKDGTFGQASHAYIRLPDPSKLELLRTYVAVEMVLQDLSFPSPRFSRVNGQVIGHAPRTVFDTAVWVPGRLIFCAKPDVQRAPGYTVGGADVRIVNEGAGPLDVSWLTAPGPNKLVTYRKATGTRLVTRMKGAALHTSEYGQLTLDTEIEVKGVVKPLSAWLAAVPESGKLRCEAPFRASSSEAAFVGLTAAGKPYIHDIGTSTTHYLATEKPSLSVAEVLAECAELSADDTAAIDEVVKLAAGLKPVEKDKVFKAIKARTGVGLGTLREQAKGSDGSDKPDQLALAHEVLAEIGPDNILHTQQSFWLWMPTGVWQKVEDASIKQVAQEVIARCGENVTSSLVDGVTSVLANHLHSADHAFNRGNPDSVNCLNGELELEGGEWVLRPHRRELYRTTQIPVAYDRDATAPLFTAFLADAFRDDLDREDKIRAVLEMFGYTLMSHARHEKFVVLIGAGANGKSVLLSLLEALCGTENTVGVQPSNFDHKFQRAHLHHKLANLVTELKQREILADAELKAIVSGEPSTVEHKFKNPFTMRPYATCWFGTNHMPSTKDFSEALFRRALIVTFNRVFSKSEQDPHLKQKLMGELPGILNLCLDAYAAALASGFTQPPSSLEALADWKLDADQVAQFVEERCIRNRDGKVRSSEIYREYKLWAEQNGLRNLLTNKGFRDRLNRLGFGKRRDRDGNWVLGLSVSRIAA